MSKYFIVFMGVIGLLALTTPQACAQVNGLSATDAQGGDTTNLIDKTWNNTPTPVTDATPAANFQDLRNGIPGQVIQTNEAPDIRCSAKTLIGAKIMADNGDTAAQVQDVIIDQNGYAQKVIIRDLGFFGFNGKLLAIDFKDVVDDSGTASSLFKTVTKDLVKNATIYDSSVDASHLASSSLLNGDVKSDTGDSLARISNIVLSNQTEPYLVLAYSHNSTPGTALVKYKDVEKASSGQGTYIQLTKPQADFFKAALINKK